MTSLEAIAGLNKGSISGLVFSFSPKYELMHSLKNV